MGVSSSDIPDGCEPVHLNLVVMLCISWLIVIVLDVMLVKLEILPPQFLIKQV